MEDETLKLIQDLKDDVEVSLDDLEFIKSQIDSGELENLFEIVTLLNTKIDTIKLEKGDKGDKGEDGKDGADGKDGLDGLDGVDGKDGVDGLDGSSDTPEDIAVKLNTLENKVDWKVLKDFKSLVNQDTLKGALSTLENQTRYLIQKSNTGGSSTVVTDGTYIGGDGTAGDPVTLLGVSVDGTTVIGNGADTPLSSVSNPTGKYLISGGIAWSGSGYIYDVSTLNYVFDGVFYTSSPTQVTMEVADPTDNRFDAVVVDIAGTVTVITGTASPNPEFPTIPEDQLAVGYVLVIAGSTTPTIGTDNIYLDNAEWTTTTYTTGSGSLGSIDFNSTNAPYQGTKCAEATATNNRLGMKFTRGTAIDVQTFAFVQIWARLTAAVATNKNLTVRFDNSLGNPVGNTVNLFNYGMSRTITGTWQLVVVPVSAFGAITNIKGLRAIMSGGVISNTATWSLDFMLLSTGILPQNLLGPIYLSPSNTLYSTGAATGATAVGDSIFFGDRAGFQASNAASSIFLGKNAGYEATDASYSNFIGEEAGYRADLSQQTNFIGYRAGYNATFGTGFEAKRSNFFGYEAGVDAGDANNSQFFGYQAGSGATNASFSNFFGTTAGNGATNASISNFFGYRAGYGATNATNATFIGYQSGDSDTVDNTGGGYSVLIGPNTGTGGFSNSIAIGDTAVNTAANELVIGSSTAKIETATLVGTGAFTPQVGTTAERPATPVAGMIRFNTTTSKHEGYDGATWNNLY